MQELEENDIIVGGWKAQKLSDLCKVVKDGSHYSPSHQTSGYPLATVANMKDNRIDIASCYRISRQDYELLIRNHCDVKIGDVLFSKDGTVGLSLVYEQRDSLVVLSSIAIIRPDDSQINPYFLKYVLHSAHILNQIAGVKTGTALKRIILKDLRKVNVPVPRLSEQEKIVSILSKIDELIQKSDQIIEHTQRLKRGLMWRLLTKGIGHTKFRNTSIGEIPEGWGVSTLGEKCKIGTGGTPSRTNPEYFRGDIPWVKTTELNYDILMDTEEKISEKAIEESSARVYPKGTFVIAMVGLEAVGTRGKCAILGIDAAVNQACATIQPSGDIDTRFLYYYYQIITNRVMSLVAGTKRQNLNLELVKSIEIPVPPLVEQEKIVSSISSVDKYIQNQKCQGTVTKSLKKGLMQKLLTGKIRVKV